ncbi:MAG: glutamine-hydrolyzing GMP synthase, partial [Caldilineaceae bacterium]|nr:glutamine-hydrolyzing GMP synthase [Caldilineaceae bacterium]
MNHQTIAVLDYGSQYAQLICRRVRETQVYAELIPWDRAEEVLPKLNPAGIILSGGPNSVYATGAPTLPSIVLESGVPVLGICYGLQLLAYSLDGRVSPAREREYGPAQVQVTALTADDHGDLFANMPESFQVWMSHGDRVEQIPPGFTAIATSDNSPYAAIVNRDKQIYAIQFHPEVVHTPLGTVLLENFAKQICGCRGDWTPGHFIDETVERIRQQVGPKGHVICGLSGGVDSAVAATLVHKAIGDRLACVFVDHGLLRKDEAMQVVETFDKHQGMHLVAVDAKEEFLSDLANVTDPEQKRKLIGARFVRTFEAEAATLAESWQVDAPAFLAQGTLYPDVIESAGSDETRHARTIKTHHNVGGLPKDMTFQLIEPLRMLFKDEVRKVGKELNVPANILSRHPFPGPGLGIRILGDITPEKVRLLQEADAIYIGKMKERGLYDAVWQAGTILLPIQSVGVMGDERTYEQTVALRAVNSTDGMTAEWSRL